MPGTMNKLLLISCCLPAIVVLVHGGVFGEEVNTSNTGNGTSSYSKSKSPSAAGNVIVGLKRPIVPKSTSRTPNKNFSVAYPEVGNKNNATADKHSLVEASPVDMALKPVQKKSASTDRKGKGGPSEGKKSKITPVGSTASGIEVCMQQSAGIKAKKKNRKMKIVGGNSSGSSHPHASSSAATGINEHSENRQYQRRMQYKSLPNNIALFIPYTTNSTTNSTTATVDPPAPSPERPLLSIKLRPDAIKAPSVSSSMRYDNTTTNMTHVLNHTKPVHVSAKSSKSKVRDVVNPPTNYTTSTAISTPSFPQPVVMDTFFSICPPKELQQQVFPYQKNATVNSSVSSNPVPLTTCNIQFASSGKLITDPSIITHHAYELLLYTGIGLVLPSAEINHRVYTLETTLGTAVTFDILKCHQNIPSSNLLARPPPYSNMSYNSTILISKYALAPSDAISVSENCTHLKAEENYTKCITVNSSSTIFCRPGTAKNNAINMSKNETCNLVIEETIRQSFAYHCNRGNFTSLGINQCRSTVLFNSSSATDMNMTSALDSDTSPTTTVTNTSGRDGSVTFASNDSLINAATAVPETITITTSTVTATNNPSTNPIRSKSSAIIGATVGILSSIFVALFLVQYFQKKREMEYS